MMPLQAAILDATRANVEIGAAHKGIREAVQVADP
jgi:hypothetical protein